MAEIKKVYKNGTAYDVLNSDTVVDAVIPSQTGNSGKFLTTDGSDVSWATVDALPSQTGQSGKFLTTNGTTASWANPVETTKIFTLSSTSDLTNAQAAYDWWVAGGNPIIKYGTMYYNLTFANSTMMYLSYIFGNGVVTPPKDWTLCSTLIIIISGGTVSNISENRNSITIRTSAPTSGGNNIITFVI